MKKPLKRSKNANLKVLINQLEKEEWLYAVYKTSLVTVLDNDYLLPHNYALKFCLRYYIM